MKPITNVTIFHGYGARPTSQWFPWLHAWLEQRGIAVTVPAFPNAFDPQEKAWLKAALPVVARWNENTLVIAHSAGGAFLVRLLESGKLPKVGGVILVSAPFTSMLAIKRYAKFFERRINWSTIRTAANRFSIVHAENDPLVPCDHAYRYAEMIPNAELLLVKDGKHFATKTAPAVLRAVRKFIGRSSQ